MILYIKTGKTNTFEIETEYHHTIRELKELVSEKTNIPSSIIIFVWAGRVLTDDRTIARHNIQKESTLHMITNFRKMMSHKVVVRSGKYVKEINASTSMFSLVEDIKMKIQDDTGIPYESIHVYGTGKELDDKQSIIDIDDEQNIDWSAQND